MIKVGPISVPPARNRSAAPTRLGKTCQPSKAPKKSRIKRAAASSRALDYKLYRPLPDEDAERSAGEPFTA
jgi:hypothetical protein